MRILGVDIDSRKFAAVLFSNNKYDQFIFYLSKCKDCQERIFDLYSKFETVIKALNPDIVYIEDSMYRQNFKTSKLISESIGNCKLICKLNLIPFEIVPNKKWKKEVIGSGKATKEEIKKFVIGYQPEFVNEPQDVFDAYCIALFGVEKEKERNIKEQ